MKKRIALVLVVLMFVMTFAGCDSSDYKKAVGLYESGSYAEAAAMFDELGDYEDSVARAVDSKYMYAAILFEAGSYEEAIAVYEQIPDYQDSADKLAEAQRLLMFETYANEVTALTNGVWFYEDTSVNAVNVLTFTQENAVMKQIYYDGNGSHITAEELCAYVIDDSTVTITCMDQSTLQLPYALVGDGIEFGVEGYLTAEQVEEDLQGYWGLKSMTYNVFTGFVNSEYIYYLDNGTLQYESATSAYGYSDGTYYYYGPYDGTYTIDANGLQAVTQNEWQFGFVVRDGRAIMNRCGDDCSVYEGFKGQNGFSF